MPEKPDRSVFLLGKYLSLALTIPAGLVAGYFLGSLADHYFHVPFLRVAGIILGTITSLIKVFQELSRDAQE